MMTLTINRDPVHGVHLHDLEPQELPEGAALRERHPNQQVRR